MTTATTDLINADYRVGLPLTYRRGTFAGRFQLYHQSSHLGDEYLLRTGAQRADLTFESAELLVSYDAAPWRVYGGGEYVFAHSPSDLKPGVGRAGLEYRGAAPVVRFMNPALSLIYVVTSVSLWFVFAAMAQFILAQGRAQSRPRCGGHRVSARVESPASWH